MCRLFGLCGAPHRVRAHLLAARGPRSPGRAEPARARRHRPGVLRRPTARRSSRSSRWRPMRTRRSRRRPRERARARSWPTSATRRPAASLRRTRTRSSSATAVRPQRRDGGPRGFERELGGTRWSAATPTPSAIRADHARDRAHRRRRRGDRQRGALGRRPNLPVFAMNFVLTTAPTLWALRYPDAHELLRARARRRPQRRRHLEHASARGDPRPPGELAGLPRS